MICVGFCILGVGMLKVGYKKRLFVLWMVFFMCGVEGLECDFEI